MRILLVVVLLAATCAADPVTPQQWQGREEKVRSGRMTGGAIHLWDERRWQIHERIWERVLSGEASGSEGDCDPLLAVLEEEEFPHWSLFAPLAAAPLLFLAIGGEDRPGTAVISLASDPPAAVPEWSSFWLLLTALLLAGARRWRSSTSSVRRAPVR